MNITQFFNLFKRSPAVKVVPIGKIVSKPKGTTPKVSNEGLNNASGAKVFDPHKKHCGIPLTPTKESILHDEMVAYVATKHMSVDDVMKMNIPQLCRSIEAFDDESGLRDGLRRFMVKRLTQLKARGK